MNMVRLYSRALSVATVALALAACAGSQTPLAGPVTPLHTMNVDNGSAAGTETVLYSFTGGSDGGNAATGLAFDRHGNLYGTTVVGGTYLCGTVFKLAPQASPPWLETVLNNFSCYADGKNPHGGVTVDPHGKLDGTTVAGGSGGACASDGCGVVFQLSGTTERVLHSFTAGNDGFGPGGAVMLDPTGHMYGTTPDGGSFSEGTVYEVSRVGGGWHEKVIHAFTGGKDGAVGSLGSLLRDASGKLYGVAELGGAHNAGTVFELTPAAKHQWTLKTLYAFKGMPDAASPYGGLVADASGNLYGTTYYGGANGLGSVFELVARAGGYHERVLYSFQGGNDGSSTTSTLIFGTSGDLYGTTSAGGGTCDCGTIFKVNPNTGRETVLHRFGSGTDGAYSYYGLTQDASGNMYGTTVAGGNFNQGAVFEFTPR
ncbi:MAG: choice-of-anchor tandem repeat GloVer-containing protein [Candidatus Tumulicola sp.]